VQTSKTTRVLATLLIRSCSTLRDLLNSFFFRGIDEGNAVSLYPGIVLFRNADYTLTLYIDRTTLVTGFCTVLA